MANPPLINPSKTASEIINFITSTFQSADKTQAIVAVSGGIDSAVSLNLASQALTPTNVYALHLPSKSTRPLNTQHAYLAMETAQIPDSNRQTINIGSIIQKSWRIIKHYSETSSLSQPKSARSRTPPLRQGAEDAFLDAKTVLSNRLRLANLAARIRMMVLFDQAKKHDCLVVGTENLSEQLLGYYTRFGDEASDLEPISHLYKNQIIELAKYLKIPDAIISKPPSADLWPGQTDANELGFTYAQADPILYLNSCGKTKKEIIAEGFPEKLVTAVLITVSKNTFKHLVPYHLQ